MTRPFKGRFHICEVKYYTFFIIALLGISAGLGQKVVRKVMLLPHVTSIQIDAERFSEVKLKTAPGAELMLQASMEGEYQKDLEIELTETGNTLRIAGDFQPFFEVPGDKLSAHKVIALELEVIVPEDKNVLLYGTNTYVMASGNYRELEVVLSDGHCRLEEIGSKVKVTTQSGHINLDTEQGIIKAKTKYGSLKQEDVPAGRERFTLNSNSGNIVIKRIL